MKNENIVYRRYRRQARTQGGQGTSAVIDCQNVKLIWSLPIVKMPPPDFGVTRDNR
ncbi:MAG: hypothetical protein MZV70_24050 [Desulfobacterales bacterium]|nr:hypothetical protein [Desulfobacterales bacterium]